MRRMLIATALILACAGTSMAGPAVYFSDNFNSETWGLNAVPSQWTVSGGTVDIIGDGTPYAWLPAGNGLYVDLDGSTGTEGLMTTIATFNLLPGTVYTLQYDLAGNQALGNPNTASPDDTVTVTLGSLTFVEVVPQNQALQTYTHSFMVGAPELGVQLSFQNADGVDRDLQGALLDNVLLTGIPAPGALLLGSLGAGLVGWLRRRRAL